MVYSSWRKTLVAFFGAGLMLAGGVAGAQSVQEVKQAISANWAQNMPALAPVAEVRATAIPGLYEVLLGEHDVLYSDAKGNYVIHGEMLDLPNQLNLTQERINQLTAVDFKALPFDDAIVIKRGDGTRKVAVFEDPNCGYCHRFEEQLATVDNVTVYVFLYPMLSPESHVRARNIWCAADPALTWQNWMLQQQPPAEVTCDTAALDRNVAFGQKYRINGTPTLIFEDGTSIPGAIDAVAIEKRVIAATQAK